VKCFCFDVRRAKRKKKKRSQSQSETKFHVNASSAAKDTTNEANFGAFEELHEVFTGRSSREVK
jgi:hypothetical protein